MLNSQPKTSLSNKLLYFITAITGILIAVVVVFGHILTPLSGASAPFLDCYAAADPLHFATYYVLTPLVIVLSIPLFLIFALRRVKRLLGRIVLVVGMVVACMFIFILTVNPQFGQRVVKDGAGQTFCAEVKSTNKGSDAPGVLYVFKCENLKCEVVKTVEGVLSGNFQFKQASDGSQTVVVGTRLVYP